MEIVFESLQKSLLFFSLILFLPVFTAMNSYYGFYNIRKTEFYFIVFYSLFRVVFYPALYLTFFKYPMLGLYFVEVTNISETCLLLLFYLAMYKRMSRILSKSETFNLRRTAILESLFSRFKAVALVFFVQFGIEIVYKLGIIGLVLLDTKKINLILLDTVFFLRLVSFSLQFYCLISLSLPDEKDSPDTIFWIPNFYRIDDFLFFNPYCEKGKWSDKIPEQKTKYYTQPNGGTEDNDDWGDIHI
jgi:hypothetical protein